MTSPLKTTLAGISLAAPAATGALAEDPRPVDPAVATSKDSGTLDRAAPEMKLVIEKLIELGAKPVDQLTVDEARAQPTPTDAVKAVITDQTGKPPVPEAIGQVEDTKIAGAAGELDARIYWPAEMTAGEALPVIVYFHGGGWVIANLDVYDSSPRALANQARALVVSVHYRQAPEDKFPAAHDDAIAAFKYVVENAGKWNGDGSVVALAGESAGGNLALDVAMAARDQKLTQPRAVLAVYPVAGSDLETQSYIDNQNAIPLGKAGIEWFVDKYLNSMDEAKDPRIDIVGSGDVAGLPPVTIVAAEIDPLNTEGTLLRDKLQGAGNDVAYMNWNGVTHEFFGMAPLVPEAKAAQDFAGERLRAALGTQ